MQISAIHVQPAATLESLEAGRKPSDPSNFAAVLRSAVDRVESAGATAANAVDAYLSGRDVDVHTTALAAQKASLELDMFLQVRNKVVQAYQEIMRMQL